MLRTFTTHEFRKQTELSGKLWSFTPIEGEMQGKQLNVLVPSCWETYPGFENYRGKAVYETKFNAEGNIKLEFKGVSHMGRVYLDDIEIASHYNAYTPFEAIAKALKPGMHTLKVEVDNSYKEEYALNWPNDYMSYGGISRGVILENISDVFISRIHLTPLEHIEDKWTARLEIYCNNISESEQEVVVDFNLHKTSYSQNACIAIGESKTIDIVLDFEDIETWSIEDPKLYEMKATLSINGEPFDDLIERTGFRTISIADSKILLNNKPIRFKGFNRHEDHPIFGCAIPLEVMAYDLSLIKDMGANSIRTAHYPNDELFLDLCDEMGILVWEEHHVRAANEEAMKNPYFEIYAEQVIKEMITYHYNHPSIYIWGIMNECASDTEYGRECYIKQYKLIRGLDTKRPCSSATCKQGKDICLDLPDVVSWNIYPYWYEDKTAIQMIDEIYKWTQNIGKGTGKPFLITEIGAGAIYGYRSPEHDKWTEEYQAEALRKQITEVMSYKDCIGLYIWQFCDIRISKEWFSSRPRTRNNKGVVDEHRRRKLVYEVVKELFNTYTDYL